jgi:arsenate reductase
MTNKISPKILVLCTGNSCRSQIMHGVLKKLTDGKATIWSAGVETHGLNKNAVKFMKEEGIDISKHTSNLVDEYADISFDYVITVCDHANERCPIFPSTARKLHHNFSDPSKVNGTDKEIEAAFKQTISEIKAYSVDFIKTI